MAVKIFITRKGIDKNIIELTVLLKKMRSLTLNQPGYIYGETLRRIDQPDECVVISTWRSREDWENWLNSPQRQSVQSEIDLLLGDTTEYAVYEE
ncbi:antibiotic biosynthesis monooxygenase family protein [Desulfofustis glycolicus]|uniref:Antibiotic biosynthesis monooxygenase n=1 Tax=Desulfofustis glycolicus DSM 9705 TaxID=1121409 RepID=A0A1M5WMF7_9BACT|nr:antibiotic biosynthesis monooxygenase family protein [Desulfofustis glycolicus]MCB2217119.1 antibiotic biosynthesis monooxygenase [Desulfobulbaceae bacterium]SHH88374.1 Antibiotic biosynthesis monooxygenase [Desulfofustis glycolicus DSM 9705]